MRKLSLFLLLSIMVLAGCLRNTPDVIVITATFQPDISQLPTLSIASTSVGAMPTSPPQINLNTGASNITVGGQYIVQRGDTLSGIAAANGVSLQTLLALNPLANPDTIEVGQLILLPAAPSETSPNTNLLPDSKLVRGPGSNSFDVSRFIAEQSGYARMGFDLVNGQILSTSQIVQRVALEYSIDPRLLIAILEYKAEWLTRTELSEDAITYPLGIGASAFGFDRNGLYRQLTWGADQLNYAYYNWKMGNLSIIEFADGNRVTINPNLNAATVAVQYLMSRTADYYTWQRQVSENGLMATYQRYFGDPYANAVATLVPPELTQPELTLPFSRGQTWYYTGGPHGGWGSGSAWAAVDFAPPDDLSTKTTSCYLSDYFVTAVADGVIARTDEGTVILDLDNDGDESTGWTILYLHIASQDRIAQGTQVRAGDRIGRPSCEGGFSNGTHLHIGRRYNGEWLPASCQNCPASYQPPTFVMSNWSVTGIVGQEYQGYISTSSQQRVAEQGRGIAPNEVSW